MKKGSGLEENCVDFVMLFNILHLKRPEFLLKEAFRILKLGSGLGIIHWKYDSTTPREPSIDIRPKPEHIKNWAKYVGFYFSKAIA